MGGGAKIRFFNKIKSIFSGSPSIEELEKIPLMNEKWITAEFEFPFSDSVFTQLTKISSKESPTREEVIVGFLLPKLGEMGKTKRLACLVEKETTPPTVLLRFPDRDKEDEEMEGWITHKNTEKSEYRFTPIEQVKYQDCFHSIEKILLTTFRLKDIQTSLDMVEFYFKGLNEQEKLTEKEVRKRRVMVERTDNISYFNYPLEKRVELFSKQEEAEKWLTENLFGESFKELIDFIMEKEGSFKFSEIYCSEVRELLKKYNIDRG